MHSMALVYDYKDPLNMRVLADYRPAAPGTREVRVKVASVGLNPIDYKIPQLFGISWWRRGTPVGVELAGVVEEVGRDVKHIKKGDVVFGGCSKGALAKSAICNESEISSLPNNLDPKLAGGYAAVALTALQGLRAGEVNPEISRVLILGASGGVGHVAVQLAKKISKCKFVCGVSSGKNADFVKAQGADEVFDYTAKNFRLSEACERSGELFDLVFDAVSNPNFDYEPEAWKCLKSTGKYVAINTARTTDWPRAMAAQLTGWNFFQRSNYRLVMCNFNKPDIDTIGNFISSGALKVTIAKTVPFTAALDAYAQLKTERTVGKLVVQLD